MYILNNRGISAQNRSASDEHQIEVALWMWLLVAGVCVVLANVLAQSVG
jgi:hypothetical protein